MSFFKSIFIYAVIALSISSVSIFTTTCGPVPFHRTGEGQVDANVAYGSSETRSLIMNNAEVYSDNVEKIMEIKAFPEAIQLVDNYYASIGTKKATLTPRKFKVIIHDIVLFGSDANLAIVITGINKNTWNNSAPEAKEEEKYADFTNPLFATPTIPVVQENYDSFMITVYPGNTGHFVNNGQTMVSLMHQEIIVEIPGYTDTELPDIVEQADTGFGTGYDRYYLGGNEFRFTFGKLIPDCLQIGSSLYSLIFNSTQGQTEIIVPGYDSMPDDINAINYTSNPGAENYGNVSVDSPIILMPFSAINLFNKESITFTIFLDIDNIIEVYEGPTGANTDDIVVLANQYWTRFSFSSN